MSDEEKTLQALIFQYGEPLVTRWALTGETAYKRRKAPKKVNPRKELQRQLQHMTDEELEELRRLAQS